MAGEVPGEGIAAALLGGGFCAQAQPTDAVCPPVSGPTPSGAS
jgi:hypothetical protein